LHFLAAQCSEQMQIPLFNVSSTRSGKSPIAALHSREKLSETRFSQKFKAIDPKFGPWAALSYPVELTLFNQRFPKGASEDVGWKRGGEDARIEQKQGSAPS